MPVGVEVVAPAQQAEVGLGLVVIVDFQRMPGADDRPTTLAQSDPQPVDPVQDTGMGWSDRRHLDDLFIDQLDAQAPGQDAVRAHGPVLGEGEFEVGWGGGRVHGGELRSRR